MSVFTTKRPPAMRHGQRLTEEELRAETRLAIEKSGLTQREVARRLNITEQAVSNAVRETGSKYVALQRRIIALLTPYSVEISYVVARKDRSAQNNETLAPPQRKGF